MKSPGGPARSREWFEELETIGVQNVRARLAQFDAGSGGAIAIGSVQYLTIGFAQEWLAWHDRKREALEAHRHNQEVFWTRFAALAATVAAAAAVTHIACMTTASLHATATVALRWLVRLATASLQVLILSLRLNRVSSADAASYSARRRPARPTLSYRSPNVSPPPRMLHAVPQP